MKVVIDGYEVEIKAKGGVSERYNEADTMAVLNTLAIYAGEAAVRYSDLGLKALKRHAWESRDRIVDAIKATEYHGNCE